MSRGWINHWSKHPEPNFLQIPPEDLLRDAVLCRSTRAPWSSTSRNFVDWVDAPNGCVVSRVGRAALQVSSVRTVPSAGRFSPFGPRGICLLSISVQTRSLWNTRGIPYTIRAPNGCRL